MNITKEELISRIKVNELTGCWEWQGGLNRGYGTTQGRLVHRVAWELWKGPIPRGLKVCHDCDNPPCFNPDHLFIGTTRDNLLDAARKGRLLQKLNPEKVVAIKSDTRLCHLIAKDYGISRRMVRYVQTGRYHSHIK